MDPLLLIKAIRAGDCDAIERQVQDDVDCLKQSLNEYNQSAIFYACSHNQPRIVQYILDKEPQLLEVQDQLKQTPLLIAVAKGNIEILELLIQRGADLWARQSRSTATQANEHSVLEWARIHNHKGCIDLIEQAQLKQTLERLSSASTEEELLIVNQFQRIIDNKNASALNQLFINTRYFQQLNLEHQLGLLSRAHQSMDKSLLELLITPTNFPPEHVLSQLKLNLIQWAAKNGLTDIVALLIDRGEAPNQQVLQSDSPDAGQSLMQLAHVNGHYETTLLLIGRQLNDSNHENLLKSIASSVHAQDLAAIVPESIPYLQKNKRIIALMQADPHLIHAGDHHFGYQFKTLQRRRSFLFHLDLNALQLGTHRLDRILGEGADGPVRLAISPHEKPLAIKSITNAIEPLVKKEQSAMSRFYSTKPKVLLFSQKQSLTGLMNSRLIMPYFKGEDISKLLLRTTNCNDLALLILKIAEAVNKIASLGLVHGDLKEDNILGYKGKNGYKIRIIDFEHAADLISGNAKLNPPASRRYAPERIYSKINYVKPETNQDVYSLGYLFGICLSKHPSQKQLKKSFPMINSFIQQALTIKPEKRPSLLTFCNQLRESLDNLAGLPDSCPKPV